MIKKAVFAAMALVMLAACSPFQTNPIRTLAPGLVTEDPSATQTATPFQPEESDAPDVVGQPTPSPSPTLTGQRIFIPPSAPPSLREAVQQWGMIPADDESSADAILKESTTDSESADSFSAFYALVAPFATITDSVSFADVQNAWAGVSSGPFAGHPLMMDQATYDAMLTLFGEPAPGAVRILPADKLLDAAWAELPTLAVVPFESLNPRWKVLEVEGQSPLREEFDPTAYPLKVHYSCEGNCGDLPSSNRDSSRMTTLIMTGTTALVRATAAKMEEKGLDFPAQDIGSILREADILHITNEIAFVDDCPYPDPNANTLQFCSDPRYIVLLEHIGTDVVELTGNHINDWGSDWLISTIDLYKLRGWGVFGGGSNSAEAAKPFTTEVNGNMLAFIGCNLPGPQTAWATETDPGAAACGDFAWILAEVTNLREAGYLPVVTVQYSEYYQLRPTESQARDFMNLAEAGAVVVSGSQSHFPQGFAFEGDAYIHYGPGNLFFDQMDYPVAGTRRAAIDRYTIYEGKVIGVELITTMLEDWARPRLMTDEERQQFLLDLFTASGW